MYSNRKVGYDMSCVQVRCEHGNLVSFLFSSWLGNWQGVPAQTARIGTDCWLLLYR